MVCIRNIESGEMKRLWWSKSQELIDDVNWSFATKKAYKNYWANQSKNNTVSWKSSAFDKEAEHKNREVLLIPSKETYCPTIFVDGIAQDTKRIIRKYKYVLEDTENGKKVLKKVSDGTEEIIVYKQRLCTGTLQDLPSRSRIKAAKAEVRKEYARQDIRYRHEEKRRTLNRTLVNKCRKQKYSNTIVIKADKRAKQVKTGYKVKSTTKKYSGYFKRLRNDHNNITKKQ